MSWIFRCHSRIVPEAFLKLPTRKSQLKGENSQIPLQTQSRCHTNHPQTKRSHPTTLPPTLPSTTPQIPNTSMLTKWSAASSPPPNLAPRHHHTTPPPIFHRTATMNTNLNGAAGPTTGHSARCAVCAVENQRRSPSSWECLSSPGWVWVEHLSIILEQNLGGRVGILGARVT